MLVPTQPDVCEQSGRYKSLTVTPYSNCKKDNCWKLKMTPGMQVDPEIE